MNQKYLRYHVNLKDHLNLFYQKILSYLRYQSYHLNLMFLRYQKYLLLQKNRHHF